jgi:hypothetical protein
MTITLNGTTGITNDGGYTGDGVVFADTTPANTLVTTTDGNVGIGTSSTSGARLAVRSGTSAVHTILGNDYGALYLETASGGPNRITSLNSGLSAGQALAFNGSGGAEWGRFDTSGNLLVGKSSAGTSNTGFEFTPASGVARINLTSSGTGVQSKIVFYNNSGTYCGEIYTGSGTSTTYSNASDYRLKEDVQAMQDALSKVMALKPVTYKWKSDGSTGEGFIAHELQEVIPLAVSRHKDSVDADGNPEYQGIDQSKLVATLTAAIQELKAIVDAQGAEIAALKGTQP